MNLSVEVCLKLYNSCFRYYASVLSFIYTFLYLSLGHLHVRLWSNTKVIVRLDYANNRRKIHLILFLYILFLLRYFQKLYILNYIIWQIVYIWAKTFKNLFYNIISWNWIITWTLKDKGLFIFLVFVY